MTRLAAAIMVDALEPALAEAARAAEFGAELVEYRLDRFTSDLPAVTELVSRSPLPCIITVRPSWEGGHFAGSEADRIDVFRAACSGARRPAYLDVELAAWEKSATLRAAIEPLVDHPGQAKAIDTALILSSHDFEQRPPRLMQRIMAMADASACRVIKVAWQARSLRDNLEAFDIITQQYKPTIALCMGQFGQPARVLAKKFGALLTFAALDERKTTAPGQPTLNELKQLYRWDKQNRNTCVFGVIGYPVGHSLSPAIHNAGFDAIDYNGVYLPMPIPPEYEHFKATVITWLDMAPLHFGGASVTIPHKQNLLRFVEEQQGEIEPLAASIGAANTLTRRDDGSLYASNTDYAAALDAVCEPLSIAREELAGRKVAVIGAGGAARAIVAGFSAHNAQVTIYNRTPDRAHELASQFNAQAESLNALPDSDADVFINCTPIGMHPSVGVSPVTDDNLPRSWRDRPGDVVVFDTIYNPLETKLLQQAKSVGCRTIPGTEMFIRQAAAQFTLWTNQPAPLDVFRNVMLNALQ